MAHIWNKCKDRLTRRGKKIGSQSVYAFFFNFLFVPLLKRLVDVVGGICNTMRRWHYESKKGSKDESVPKIIIIFLGNFKIFFFEIENEGILFKKCV